MNLKEILTDATQKGYAVPAFNFNNLETLQAIMEAAEQMKSPVILQTSEGAIKYAGMEYLLAMGTLAAKSRVPVALHLDHGRDINIIKEAIPTGYTSIMFDGSLLSFEENMKTTWRIVQWAHTKNISVEAELGAIKGIEDLVSVKDKEAALTHPDQAKMFVEKTECDALAVAIGTSHGAYKYAGKPKLDLARLKKINDLVAVPLVLHGASGVPRWLKTRAIKSGLRLGQARGVSDDLIRKAIKLGVRKINIDTDLRIAFAVGVREITSKHNDVFDPRKILGPARELMRQVVMEKMKLFGSAHKA